jgi:hypothetical protein
MADFSLTTLFVTPITQTMLPNAGSTQDLTAGQVGIFLNTYAVANAGNIAAAPYFYVAQGRENTYLQGSKRSDKIKGCAYLTPCNSNVIEWYKVAGCATPLNQISQISDWSVQCGEIVTVSLRAHSSYLDTLYHNGLTRSVTVNAPCCECGADPCTDVDVDALIDMILEKLTGYNTTDGVIDWASPISPVADGINPDNWDLNTYFTFSKVGSGATAILQIEGKPLTKYGQPCDVSAFPFEYDRMWFNTFVYEGPDTSADFIVSDACNIVAVSTVVQTSNYVTGTSEEIAQLEKDYHSYQAGYMKHLHKLPGYNATFESYVSSGAVYDTYYIRFNEYYRGAYNWGDYVPRDSTVIIAVESGSDLAASIESVLEASLGTVLADNVCITTTSTTTAAPTTTTTTTGA